MNEDFIKKAPMYSFKNKEAVSASQICGCYNCLNIINTNDIEFWTDDDETALCPNCTLDTLIAESFQVQLDKETLQKIRDHWFKI